MKILALDISSAEGGVAVAVDGEITDVRRLDVPRGRGAEVFSALEDLRPAWEGLDRMAVGIGPGSYNGLRTACALAESFQRALGIEIVAAPSPCLLDVREERYFAAGDARGGMVYLAEVEHRCLRGEVRLIKRDEFFQMADGVSPAPIFRVGVIAGAEKLFAARPDAVVLARLAPSLIPLSTGRLSPIYLKPPHITTPRVG